MAGEKLVEYQGKIQMDNIIPLKSQVIIINANLYS